MKHWPGATCLLLGGLLLGRPALAEPEVSTTFIDGIAARFHAPEIGGVAQPRFITHRELAFEATILARLEKAEDNFAFEERHARLALDRILADTLLAELPMERVSKRGELRKIATDLQWVTAFRLGGEDTLVAIAKGQGFSADELTRWFERRARAAFYVNRSVTQLLSLSEAALRESFRTTNHPFRGKTFDEARESLAKWIMDEKLRSAELAFVQNGRSRIAVSFAREAVE
ncbi:MAG: hypothetical protein KBF88_00655 [Polyangiaceae bacterium]|nr:hypothetical protein [Polyangiaceae bacterium]